MIDRSRPVTVVGAGIAGLTAALCLARRGFRVEMFERSRRLEEAGAGLQLSPNALRVIFQLGLRDRILAKGLLAGWVRLRSGRAGRVIADVPVSSQDGTPYLSILRADLQAALLAAVESEPTIALTLDAALAGVRPSALEPRAFDLEWRNGAGFSTVLHARPLVLAADGVRSGVAASLGLAPPRPSGLVAWRAMAEPERPVAPGIEAWLGRRHHAVAYPVDGGRRINLVAVGRDPGAETLDRAELLARFRGWDPALLGLFASAGPIGEWPLLEVDRMAAVVPEGLLLLGDAAHAMLPFAAQGAAMAIEDAAVAADAIGRAASPAEAARLYRQARGSRIARVRRRVAFHRHVYHLPWPLSLGRDGILAARSREALGRDLAWLYDWRPPEMNGRGSQ